MKKQIVVLMTDTTRKDMVGCYGNEKMKTPNLDRLAQEAFVMRMLILVSLYAARHEVQFLLEHFHTPMELSQTVSEWEIM